MTTAERCLAMQATGGGTYMTTAMLGAGEPWDLASSCNVFPPLAITPNQPLERPVLAAVQDLLVHIVFVPNEV